MCDVYIYIEYSIQIDENGHWVFFYNIITAQTAAAFYARGMARYIL